MNITAVGTPSIDPGERARREEAVKEAARRNGALERGYRLWPGDPRRGDNVRIMMYCDQPGHFFNERGEEVPDDIARRQLGPAKFDKFRRERRLNEERQRAREMLSAAGVAPEVTVAERGEYRLIAIGALHGIKRTSGEVIAPTTLPKEVAAKLLDALAGEAT